MRERLRRIDRMLVLRVVLAVAAIALIVVVVSVSLRRAVYPFELEWMEGAMVDHVERVLQGKQLYVEPSVEFVPFIYGPLYFWLSAGVAKVVGLSFLPLRIVSIASMAGSFVLIHAVVAKETDDRVAGVVAAGAFAGTYVRSAQFLDIGRVDSLSLVLSLAAIYVMRNLRERRFYWAFGAVLLGLSFLAKQSSFLLALAMIAHEVWIERKRAAAFALATLVSTLGVAILIDHAHHGWFRYYTWELPRSHPFVKHSLAGFWTDDLFPALAIAGVFGFYYLIAATPRRAGARFYHLATAGGMIASAWTGRLHDGGWPNVLIPAFAALAVLLGLGLGEAWRESAEASGRLRAFIAAAALAQLCALIFDPKRTLPRSVDAPAGWAFIAKLKAVNGDVFVPNHSFYARMAGKAPHAHRMAIDDVLRGDPHGEGLVLAASIRAALARKRYAAIVLDDEFFLGDALRTYYPIASPFERKDVFFPATGIHVRPNNMLVKLPD
jgi:4-amino-4-deoxy-L-arabinose transferase-like glycosyltransferase